MHAEALAVVRQGVGPGVASEELQETRHAYMRYVGQGHEISVPLPAENYAAEHGEMFRELFETAYRQLYGRIIEGVAIEALSWTLTIAKKGSEPFLPPDEAATFEKDKANRALTPFSPIGCQALFDPATGQPVEASVYLRGDLSQGAVIAGPALITEEQTTTVVPGAWSALIDAHGGIVLTRKEAADE
jgi:N-methylhydantoinase A